MIKAHVVRLIESGRIILLDNILVHVSHRDKPDELAFWIDDAEVPNELRDNTIGGEEPTAQLLNAVDRWQPQFESAPLPVKWEGGWFFSKEESDAAGRAHAISCRDAGFGDVTFWYSYHEDYSSFVTTSIEPYLTK